MLHKLYSAGRKKCTAIAAAVTAGFVSAGNALALTADATDVINVNTTVEPLLTSAKDNYLLVLGSVAVVTVAILVSWRVFARSKQAVNGM
ncbi:MAG: hypothetical protein D3916_00975 [Candidatus Electrothrix sp. MAN1_4]|nr:hypothetical protein [Candidatus Electrothrix sp. MAN1_4]